MVKASFIRTCFRFAHLRSCSCIDPHSAADTIHSTVVGLPRSLSFVCRFQQMRCGKADSASRTPSSFRQQTDRQEQSPTRNPCAGSRKGLASGTPDLRPFLPQARHAPGPGSPIVDLLNAATRKEANHLPRAKPPEMTLVGSSGLCFHISLPPNVFRARLTDSCNHFRRA